MSLSFSSSKLHFCHQWSWPIISVILSQENLKELLVQLERLWLISSEKQDSVIGLEYTVCPADRYTLQRSHSALMEGLIHSWRRPKSKNKSNIYCRVIVLDWIKDGIPLANRICITVWFPFFSFSISHQLVRGWFDLQIRQRSKKRKKKKESKPLRRTRHRSFGSSRENSVKVADSLLWHERSPQQKWESQQVNTVSAPALLFRDYLTHYLYVLLQTGWGGEKKIPIEKIITSLCHHPEGTLSVCVHWIILHVFERWGCFGWDPNWEQSVFTAYFFKLWFLEL